MPDPDPNVPPAPPAPPAPGGLPPLPPTPAAPPAPVEPPAPPVAPPAPLPAIEDLTAEEVAALGDPGKRAIDRMKGERDEAMRRARDAEAAVEAARIAGLDEHQRAIEAARTEGRNEALAGAREQMFAAHLQAATVGKLADPTDLADPTVALRLLELSEIPVTATGDIDAESISAAVAKLIERKPHLAAASATPPPGGADQGARPVPVDKDLATQIAEAEKAGDWTTSRRLKQLQLAAAPRP